MRFRDFRLFWVSTLFYSLGTGMEHVAVGWLVFDITGSAFMVGVAAAARMAPMFFLGILSGAMADWLERRLFLFFSALGGVVVAAVMATSGNSNARAMASGVSKATIPTMAGMVAALSGLYCSVQLQRFAREESQKLADHLTHE